MENILLLLGLSNILLVSYVVYSLGFKEGKVIFVSFLKSIVGIISFPFVKFYRYLTNADYNEKRNKIIQERIAKQKEELVKKEALESEEFSLMMLVGVNAADEETILKYNLTGNGAVNLEFADFSVEAHTNFKDYEKTPVFTGEFIDFDTIFANKNRKSGNIFVSEKSYILRKTVTALEIKQETSFVAWDKTIKAFNRYFDHIEESYRDSNYEGLKDFIAEREKTMSVFV